MAEDLTSTYPHLPFRRNWELPGDMEFMLGQICGYVQALSKTPILPQDHKNLHNLSLVRGIAATTAIEGNTLTEEQIENLLFDDIKIPPSKAYMKKEVMNMQNAFNDIFREIIIQNKAKWLDADKVKHFHRMIGNELGEHFDAIPGRYREDRRQVGGYACPDPEDVEPLMNRYFNWLRDEFKYNPDGDVDLRMAVVQSIVAHVYLEWIHPFGDGNGRTGRLVEFYILIRAGVPTFAAHLLSNHYNETRERYYRLFNHTRERRNLTAFLQYSIEGLRDGLESSLRRIQESQLRIAWIQHVYETFDHEEHDLQRKMEALPPTIARVSKRRRKLALSAPIENSEAQWVTMQELAFKIPETAKLYMGLGAKTLQRDVGALVAAKLLEAKGKQYRAYLAPLLTYLPISRDI